MTQTDEPTSDQSPDRQGTAIAALVLGITAYFPGCCGSMFYLNYLLAILAILFAALSLREGNSAMAKAGLILGICAIVLYIILGVTGVALDQTLNEPITLGGGTTQ